MGDMERIFLLSLQLPQSCNIFNGKQDHTLAKLLPPDPEGIKHHYSIYYGLKTMFNLKVVEGCVFSKNVLKKNAKPVNIPLPVSKVVDIVSDGLLRLHIKNSIE